MKFHIQSISTTHFRCTIFAFSFISLLHWELCCCCCYCAESQRHFNKSIDLRGPSLNFNVHLHIFATSFFPFVCTLVVFGHILLYDVNETNQNYAFLCLFHIGISISVWLHIGNRPELWLSWNDYAFEIMTKCIDTDTDTDTQCVRFTVRNRATRTIERVWYAI